MTQGKKKPISSEEKLNNLAMILSEQDPDEKPELSKEDQQFLERAMTLIREWRHEYMIEEGRRKKRLFERFAEPLRKQIALARETGRELDLASSDSQLKLALTGTHFRKLQEITKSDLVGAALDDELLKLFAEVGESLDEEA